MIKEKIRIRPSSISEFAQCGWKWYNKFMLGKEEATNGRALVGTAIHKAAELFWLNCQETGTKEDPMVSMYQEAALFQLEKSINETKTITYSGKDDKDILVYLVKSGTKAYFEDIVPYVPIPTEVESFLALKIKDNPFVYEIGGTCDQYDAKNLIASDIKTSSKTSYFSTHILQLSIYKLLIEKINKVKLKRFHVQGVTLYKTKEAKGSIIPVVTNVDQAVYIVKNLLESLKLLQTDKIDPKLLFRGNPQYHFCNDMFCGRHKDCPFVTG